MSKEIKDRNIIISGKTPTDTFDSLSVQRINTLHPNLIEPAMRVFNRARSGGIPLYIMWGTRTLKDQDLMFRYGRDLPGKILTTNRPGHSAHNYGLALDFCLFYNRVLFTWEDVYERWYWRQRWLKVVFMFEEEGWESGWRWTSFEPYHVQNLMGNTMTDLVRKYEQVKNRNNWLEALREQDKNQGVHFQSEEEI
jgi:peptidoglycan L-alanyl-D-glutamate endopeptidase CwlK